MSTKPTARTLDDFLQELGDKDMSIKEWARQEGFNFNAVYMVLHGRSAGMRGEGRKVLRAMGLPVPPVSKTVGTAVRQVAKTAAMGATA